MSNRVFLAGGLLVALVLAGGLSFYASSHPDGLEYVAEQTGFLDSAEEHPGAGGPFADYTTQGVDDARVSGGLAGVVGTLVVLLLAGGIGFAVRRRGTDPGADSSDGRAAAPQPDETSV